MKNFITLMFVLFLAACMQAAQTDLEGLKAMLVTSQSAFDARDPAAIAAIYAEDGEVMSPNSESVTGQAAIENYWREVLDSGFDLGVAKTTNVYANGDVGYETGTYAVTDPGGAVDEGKYVRIWRHSNGNWQVQHVTWNSDAPLSAADAETESDPKSLYHRLGGYDVVAALFDNTGSRIGGDPDLSMFFGDIDERAAMRGRQLGVNLLCQLVGGPCFYIGSDLKTTHKGLGITDDHWQSFMGHLGDTLDEMKIDGDERTDVIAIFAGLKDDIVN